MSLAVVDASVLAVLYASDDHRRDRAVERLSSGDVLHAPAHLDAEVVSALRGMARGNSKVDALAEAALRHLAGFPIRRLPLTPLLGRMWELRENVTPYDAAYVSLAERLDSTLITCDARLASATGPQCRFDLIA